MRAQTSGFEVIRNGNAVLARTALGRPSRVLLAGHLDTVPVAGNLPSRLQGGELHGCGTADMKSGDAVFLHLAATVAEPVHDLTLVLYDCEEIDSAANGLGRIERELPDWLAADVAILGEPTAGFIEAGCQGTLRVVISACWNPRAFSAILVGGQRNSQTGRGAGPAGRLSARSVDIDGCEYREGLSAVRIDGGVAGNVIPDAASVTVNSVLPRTVRWARRCSTCMTCSTGSTWRSSRPTAAAGALPGLSAPAAAALVEAAGGQVRAKYGWTDVSRFAALGDSGGQLRAR